MERRFLLCENFHRLMNGESEGIRMPVIEWAARIFTAGREWIYRIFQRSTWIWRRMHWKRGSLSE